MGRRHIRTEGRRWSLPPQDGARAAAAPPPRGMHVPHAGTPGPQRARAAAAARMCWEQRGPMPRHRAPAAVLLQQCACRRFQAAASSKARRPRPCDPAAVRHRARPPPPAHLQLLPCTTKRPRRACRAQKCAWGDPDVAHSRLPAGAAGRRAIGIQLLLNPLSHRPSRLQAATRLLAVAPSPARPPETAAQLSTD